jgi:hypothetical protein
MHDICGGLQITMAEYYLSTPRRLCSADVVELVGEDVPVLGVVADMQRSMTTTSFFLVGPTTLYRETKNLAGTALVVDWAIVGLQQAAALSNFIFIFLFLIIYF